MLLHKHQLGLRLRLFIFHRRRLIYTYAAAIVALCLFLKLFGPKTYVYPQALLDIWSGEKFVWQSPPDYTALYEWEDALPQHDLGLPFPEGRTGKYVKFSNQIEQLGWNNVFNEILMNTHLAYSSNRAYVFQDYIWKSEYHPWLIPFISFSPSRRHPRTPLSALISGPSAGAPWDHSDPAPRSVSSRHFDIVCPPSERLYIHTQDIKPALINASAEQTFEVWKELLLRAPERCVEVLPAPLDEDPYPQTFDLMIFGTPKVVPMWERFVESPTSRLLGPSPVVKSAVEYNMHLFMPSFPLPPSSSHLSVPPFFPSHSPSRNSAHDLDPLKSTLSLHLRLGDFSSACIDNLAAGNWTFYSWNNLPFLPSKDRFMPPPGGKGSPGHPGWNSEENVAIYLERCQPSIERVLGLVREVRKEWESSDVSSGGLDSDTSSSTSSSSSGRNPLETIYILTNESNDLLRRLISELYKDGWKRVVTTADLVFPDEVDRPVSWWDPRGWSLPSFLSSSSSSSSSSSPSDSSSSSQRPSSPHTQLHWAQANQRGWSRSVSGSIDMEIARRSAAFIGNGWSSFTSNIVHQRLSSGHEAWTCRFW